MKRKLRSISARLAGETGNALIIVLVLLVLGSLTLVPTLAHITTALKGGRLYEQKADEVYTADSGIEDGLWRIKFDFMGLDYHPYDFTRTWHYETEDINGMTANFSIRNVWFPSDATPESLGLTPDDLKAIIESGKLNVVGTAGTAPGQPYHIKIDFTPDIGDNLSVKSLGVWLPQGFTYSGNCSLMDDENAPYYPDEVIIAEAPGGKTIVWRYDPPYPLFTEFPGVDPQIVPMVLEFTFTYEPPPEHPNWLPLAIGWITTNMEVGALGYANPNDVPISWDVDTRFYHIVSEAGETIVEAYTSKSELRQMGDAISGDYVAIGNSLLSDNNGDHIRETWNTPSSFNLTTIPQNADAIYAFLYWAGWRNEAAKQNILNDDCTSFSRWVRSQNEQTQMRVPTGDGDKRGTWNTSPYWDDVDETTPNDGDYITGVDIASGYAYQLFTFSPFTIPSGSRISSLTVYVRARDASSGNNDIRPAIKVKGSYYPSGSNPSTPPGNNPSTSWATYSYSWTTNPATGAAWTAEDINGSGANALEQFGVYSNDLEPDVQVSMVYAQVDYCESLWALASGRFRGYGAASATATQRTLSLASSLPLSAYTPTSVVVYWEQYGSGNLESSDALYFAFSGDGGASWSDNIEAFHDDPPGSPNHRFWYPIPEEYLTANFKMRFYVNFDDPSEYVELDNIKVIYMPPDTEITFKIDGRQVYLNGAEPEEGSSPLTAGRSYVMFNSMWGAPEGYSYACVRDVSALVKEFARENTEGHRPGNALYTVDGITANTGSNFSFAGWSLIIIYAAPETAGHYIYLRDDNFAFHPGTGGNLDFDDDPSYPGGVISNFVIPEPIRDKNGNIKYPVAAKLTCFIVEGDDFTNDTSSIRITGEQSGKSMNLWNPSSPSPDVVNGRSYPGTFAEGVDIDTFEIKWDDKVDGVPILTPGDKRLFVDMYSLNDAWNLVYFIISIQSEPVTSGTTHYVIRNE